MTARIPASTMAMTGTLRPVAAPSKVGILVGAVTFPAVPETRTVEDWRVVGVAVAVAVGTAVLGPDGAAVTGTVCGGTNGVGAASVGWMSICGTVAV